MNMSVKIAGVEWKNPVTVASGTFGSGEEFSEFVDLNRLGAVTTKGVANVPWAGNPTPRVAEVYGGMMNAIGLQNPGIDLFCERDIPYLKNFDTKEYSMPAIPLLPFSQAGSGRVSCSRRASRRRTDRYDGDQYFLSKRQCRISCIWPGCT